MAKIPLFSRSHHKAKKLTDEEQEKRNKKLSSSLLTSAWVKKKKDKCYTAKRFTDLQKEFKGAVRLIHPATLYSVCPAMCRLLNEERARERVIDTKFIDKIRRSCSDLTGQSFPLWASIFRILRVLDSLRMGSKPSLETVVRYIHTEYKLKRQLNLIKGDLLILPQRLEKDYLKTSNECRELIERFEIEIAEVVYGYQLSAFLVPDALKDANSKWTWTTFSVWRKDQIDYTHPDYQAEMLSLTRYYPIDAFKAMCSLHDALSPILRILTEQIAVGNQCNDNLKKMFEELSAKLTTPASDNVWEAIGGDAGDNKAFIRKGTSVWTFGINGETAQVKFEKELKGLALIECLLINRNKEYTPLELLKAAGQRGDDESESEKVYSQADISEIKKAIKGLEGRRDNETDPQRRDRLILEIEKSSIEFHKARNYKGGSRSMSEKHRIAVIRNINTVLNRIAPQSNKLHNHLTTFLTKGQLCHYKSDSDIFWDIS